MMPNIVPSGPNPAKARFLGELATAIEFLALFHQLPAEDQAELIEAVRSRYALVYGSAPRGPADPSTGEVPPDADSEALAAAKRRGRSRK